MMQAEATTAALPCNKVTYMENRICCGPAL